MGIRFNPVMSLMISECLVPLPSTLGIFVNRRPSETHRRVTSFPITIAQCAALHLGVSALHHNAILIKVHKTRPLCSMSTQYCVSPGAQWYQP